MKNPFLTQKDRKLTEKLYPYTALHEFKNIRSEEQDLGLFTEHQNTQPQKD